MAANIRQCQRCGRVKITTLVDFKANVSLFFRRRETKLSGNLCHSCMTKEFVSFEVATLLGTWWGIIGLIIGPFFLFHNMIEYVDGSIAIVKGKRRLRLEGRTVEQDASDERQTDIKAGDDS